MPYQKINIILSISFKFVCHIKSNSTHVLFYRIGYINLVSRTHDTQNVN